MQGMVSVWVHCISMCAWICTHMYTDMYACVCDRCCMRMYERTLICPVHVYGHVIDDRFGATLWSALVPPSSTLGPSSPG